MGNHLLNFIKILVVILILVLIALGFLAVVSVLVEKSGISTIHDADRGVLND